MISLFGNSYYSFQGIPYAKPPLGELRFKVWPGLRLGVVRFWMQLQVCNISCKILITIIQDPLPLEPWTRILDATKEAPPSWQLDRPSGTIIGSENCLHLNIFTKSVSLGSTVNSWRIACNCLVFSRSKIDSSKLYPVIVYIYPGAYKHGTNSQSHVGPDYLMTKDVVLVTLSFRNGALGMFAGGRACSSHSQ